MVHKGTTRKERVECEAGGVVTAGPADMKAGAHERLPVTAVVSWQSLAAQEKRRRDARAL